MKALVIRRARHPASGMVLESGTVLDLDDGAFEILRSRNQVEAWQAPVARRPEDDISPLAGAVRIDRQATHRVLRRTRLLRDGRKGVLEPGDLVTLTEAEAAKLGDDPATKRLGDVVERLPTAPSPPADAAASEPAIAVEEDDKTPVPTGDDEPTPEPTGRRRSRR